MVGHTLPGTVASFAFGSPDLKGLPHAHPALCGFPCRELMPATHRHKYSTEPINFAACIEARGAL
jgi:hypothetical protein